MNSPLVDVILACRDVRSEVADRGPGWWLAGMRNHLVAATKSMAEHHPDPEDTRAQLVRNAAHAVLALEAFDDEQAARGEARRRAA